LTQIGVWSLPGGSIDVIVPLRQDLSPFRLLVREPLDALSFKKCLSRASEVSLHLVLRLG